MRSEILILEDLVALGSQEYISRIDIQMTEKGRVACILIDTDPRMPTYEET